MTFYLDQFSNLTTNELYALRDSIKVSDSPLLVGLLTDINTTLKTRRSKADEALAVAKGNLLRAECEVASFPDEEKRKWENLETAPKDITLKDNAGDLVAWNDLSAKWQFFDKNRDSWINLYGSEQILSEELAPFTEA